MLTAELRGQLLEAARQARKKAYAPYSRLQVGAALLTRQGHIFSGANVENASYGLTLCAERAAVAAAVTREGEGMRIRALAVVGDGNTPLPPCGACRQVIREFGDDALVLFYGPDGMEELRADQLLPLGFRLP